MFHVKNFKINEQKAYKDVIIEQKINYEIKNTYKKSYGKSSNDKKVFRNVIK